MYEKLHEMHELLGKYSDHVHMEAYRAMGGNLSVGDALAVLGRERIAGLLEVAKDALWSACCQANANGLCRIDENNNVTDFGARSMGAPVGKPPVCYRCADQGCDECQLPAGLAKEIGGWAEFTADDLGKCIAHLRKMLPNGGAK